MYYNHQSGPQTIHNRGEILYGSFETSDYYYYYFIIWFRARARQSSGDMAQSSSSDPVSVRKAMKTYWDKWATYNTESGTSFEMMLLETQSRYEYAKRLSDLDRKEIVSLLPDMKNMEVLELGAGIG